MTNFVVAVNTPVQMAFKAPTGLSSFPDFLILANGTPVASPTYTVAEVATGTGVYSVTYTPLTTGKYILYAAGSFFASLDVQARTVYSYLQNIEDEAVGSWVWNKQAGTLQMIRQDGTVLGNFAVVENITTASRERTS